MVRDYELMYIIRPELDEEAIQAAMDGVGALIEGCGGEILKVTPWGKRRLAFEVKHLRDGHYVLTKLKLDGARVTDVERTLEISDTVFRHLLVLDEGTPDDESGVPGRPSRELKGDRASVPAPVVPVAREDDVPAADGDDDGAVVAVAIKAPAVLAKTDDEPVSVPAAAGTADHEDEDEENS